MIEVSNEDFDSIVAEAIERIPEPYRKRIDNVAFIITNQPTPEQRQQLKLYPNELLFGLYEGVPLPQRFSQKMLPDKITIFKGSAEAVSRSIGELSEHVRHTVWHEVAHYFGLDHKRIHELEKRNMKHKTRNKNS